MLRIIPINFFIVILVILTIVSGCESKTDKKLNELNGQANELLDQGDLEGAIGVFNQMLALEDNEMVKDKLEATMAEYDAVETTKQLFNEFNRIHNDIGSSFSSSDIMNLIRPAEVVIDKLEKIDTSGETGISKFIKDFKQNPLYQLFKSDYLSGKTIQTGYDDFVILDTKKFRVKYLMAELLKTKLPEKYQF